MFGRMFLDVKCESIVKLRFVIKMELKLRWVVNLFYLSFGKYVGKLWKYEWYLKILRGFIDNGLWNFFLIIYCVFL